MPPCSSSAIPTCNQKPNPNPNSSRVSLACNFCMYGAGQLVPHIPPHNPSCHNKFKSFGKLILFNTFARSCLHLHTCPHFPQFHKSTIRQLVHFSAFHLQMRRPSSSLGAWTAPVCSTTRAHGSRTASGSGLEPRWASRPPASTPADRWAWRAC